MKKNGPKDILIKLKERIREIGGTDQDLLEAMVDHYFVAVSHDELALLSPDELYARFFSHFEFMRCRQVDQIKLRVFNPCKKEEDFVSKHTIIQLTQNDMPFLVDSLLMELHRRGVAIHFIMHNGAVPVMRNSRGELTGLSEKPTPEMEANVYIEVDHQETEVELMALQDSLYAVLSDVGLAVADFIGMRDSMAHLAEGLTKESKAFLEWLCDNHFTFLGYAVYHQQDGSLKRDPQNTLGLMKDQSTYGVGSFDEDFRHVPGTLKEKIVICKSEHISTVHRSAYMDAILIPEFNAQGELEKEHRFVGLYTSRAYHLPSSEIPLLSHKVVNVYKRTQFARGGHDIKTLEDIIESFPKDELFQMTEDEIYETALSVLYIQERQQVKILLRRDIFRRFYRVMIYLPRDLYTTRLRMRFQDILMHELKGISASFTPLFLPSVLCRVDFIIRVADHAATKINLTELEDKIKDVARNWSDGLYDVLVEKTGEHEGKKIYQRYLAAFPVNYQGDFTPKAALHDIQNIEKLLSMDDGIVVDFEKDQSGKKYVHLKIMQRQTGLWLTHVLPILENFGLKVIEERPYEISFSKGLVVWLSNFIIDGTDLIERFDEIRDQFKEAFLKVWYKESENDGFNRLTLLLGLSSREVVLLRAIGKYLVQIGFAYGQKYFEDTLSLYPNLTRTLVEIFFLQFDPNAKSRDKVDHLHAEFTKGLKNVISLDHDQILSKYQDVLKALVRTNYFQKNSSGHFKPYVSFKLQPDLIPDIPKPIPSAEIFVYAPEVEGVHLRAAKVARGGIRWSDRALDFRTEVLGLMKAQQVKNAVIVPLGAKGGFYPKNLKNCHGREEIQNEAIRCYKIYISAMLDITDNIIADQIIPPIDVVRYDEDDPYFVVAADKGTATFSDIANEISAEYDFWLGDAFASGGSNGYDHKKMGITARGAWESVKRHFLFLNKDIQKEDFTVVGVGDMAGDVFGNGMLLSKHTRLVAAFNHMHIFIDPNPDAASSYVERKRLFNLPRSTWEDYNPKLISEGGGVYSRSLKTIPISPEIRKVLGVEATELEPSLLIQAILRAPVELLWNGGIGTYVKASSQNNLDASDRANDPVRVNASELRCQVVGEGGNLGLTQLARVEFALLGGQICTDAIDNSAGVDCSDHEVNIKILLNAAIQNGKLTEAERNKLLSGMQDEVAALVLANNYHQTQAISNGVQQRTAVTTYIRLLRELEREGFLDRNLEGLPADKVLKARMSDDKSFTKPEFSVLMAYAKTTIKEVLLKSDLPEEGYFTRYLKAEFPEVLCERFLPEMKNHRLRREIIVTELTNEMTQYLGIAYVHRMYDEVGAFPAMSARAFAIAKDLFEIEPLWKEIEALDGKVPAEVQISMMNEITYFLNHQCRWLLRHFRNDLFVESIIRVLRADCTELLSLTRHNLNVDQHTFRKTYIAKFTEQGVPKALAERISDLYYLYSVLDMIHSARSHQIEISAMIETFYALSQQWGLSWLRQKLNELAEAGYWEMLTAASLKDDLNRYEANLVVNIIEQTRNNQSALGRIDEWSTRYMYFVKRWHILLNDFKISQLEFVRMASLLNALRDLVELCER